MDHSSVQFGLQSYGLNLDTLGVMDIIKVDQHDKWKCFGLFLHAGLDPFSGHVLWIKIWWTNRDPRLVCSYYLNAC